EAATSEEQTAFLRQAVDLYRGELLPGYYEEWVLGEQRRLAERYVAAQRRLARLLEEAGELDPALHALQLAVRADPLSEATRSALVQLNARAGRPAEARRQFAELEQLLRDE